MDFPEKDIEAIINGIWDKTISLFGLSKSEPVVKLYKALGKRFHKAVEVGFNKVETRFDEPDTIMLNQLYKNGYLFAGAKTFTYVASTKGLMIGEDKNIIPKKDFFKLAKEGFDLQNKTWLETEYNTAIARAQSARQEMYMLKNKKILPFATWVTSHDERVCHICGAMNGITLLIDDKFWNSHPVPAHYGCKCIKQATSEGVITKDLESLPKFPEGFRTSPLNGDLFDKSHPYYDVPTKFKALLKNNFGFPIPE